MATQQQRREAIEKAVRIVHGWPLYMHSVACHCRRHGGDCGCRSCSEKEHTES